MAMDRPSLSMASQSHFHDCTRSYLEYQYGFILYVTRFAIESDEITNTPNGPWWPVTDHEEIGGRTSRLRSMEFEVADVTEWFPS